MGNRGILGAGRSGQIPAGTTQAWVCCRLSFRGRRVALDDPRRYTPLFFADEAVALAAGHRPCGECRHEDYQAFKAAFGLAFGPAAPFKAGEMDRMLHAARIRRGVKVTFAAPFGTLPDGAFVARAEAPGEALLVKAGALHPWSHAGYGPPQPAAPDLSLTVLTPAPTVAVLKAGYRPAGL